MFRLSIFSILLLTAGLARAEGPDCHSGFCDPGNGVWYSARAGEPYGQEVTLGADGHWTDRDGHHRARLARDDREAGVLSPNNSDERNGELAYQTAYDSFMEGKFNGGNKVEHRSGRWSTRITTPDGIVLMKDAHNNVAVQSPDGKWHITNARGQYASTTNELELRAPAKEMVAKAKKSGKKAVVAKARKHAKKAVVAKAKKAAGRGLASLEPAQPAGANGPTAAQFAAAAAPDRNADAKPAAPAEKMPEAEQLTPIEGLAKLAEAGRTPASAEAAKQPAAAPAQAPAPAAGANAQPPAKK